MCISISFFVYLHNERNKQGISLIQKMMAVKTNKSRLMTMSHEIQKLKKITRSKALLSAWAIVSNSEITIFYLVERYSNRNNKNNNKVKTTNLTLSLVA